MEGFAIGWRDGILVLVVVAAVYLMLVLIKLLQLRRQLPATTRHESEAEDQDIAEAAQPKFNISPLRTHDTETTEPSMLPEQSPDTLTASRDAMAAYAGAMEGAAQPNFAVRPAPSFEWDDVKELFGEPEPSLQEITTKISASETTGQGSRAGQSSFGESLATHLARSDVEVEMQRMREEMERMRREVEDLRAARRVSPQYAEAMELAQRGMTAQDVADQLGISLAEAELVHALSRSQKNFDEGDTDGAEGEAGSRAGQRARHAGRG